MKLGYRDRVVLLIAIVAVILGIGIFVFIRPKISELKTKKAELADVENNWNAQLQKYSLIEKRQNNIKKRYEEGCKLADEFSPEMSSVELDKFLRDKFLNTEQFIKDKVELQDSVSFSNIGTSGLSYYYYTPNIVTYPLYESADLDDSLKNAVVEKLADSEILKARSAQTVGSSAAGFSILVKREDAMTLLNAVNEYATKNRDTMMIESVEFADCNFNEKYLKKDDNNADDEDEVETDEDGNEIMQQKDEDDKVPDGVKPGYTLAKISYRVFYMQKPTEPYVGDPYDATIWDGDAWRTAGTE